MPYYCSNPRCANYDGARGERAPSCPSCGAVMLPDDPFSDPLVVAFRVSAIVFGLVYLTLGPYMAPVAGFVTFGVILVWRSR